MWLIAWHVASPWQMVATINGGNRRNNRPSLTLLRRMNKYSEINKFLLLLTLEPCKYLP